MQQELKQLSDEIRGELSLMVSKGQKNLKASLSVVELTVAVHYVFHAPVDKILWDIGDQVSYQTLIIITKISWFGFGFFHFDIFGFNILHLNLCFLCLNRHMRISYSLEGDP